MTSTDTARTARRPWWQAPAREDASAIVGLQSPRVLVAAVLVWTGFLILGLSSGAVDRPAWYVLAFGLLAVAWALPLRAPGTPMDRAATTAVVAATAAGVLLVVIASEPVVRGPLLPCAGTTAIIGALLCLRGRVIAAWAGLIVQTVVLTASGVIRAGPLDYVAVMVPGNLGIVVLLTVFASVVSPRAEQIFALRRQARRESASVAARAVRDQQLRRLDGRVRPLLQRIAAGQTLDQRALAQCRLVEAQLRDRIRAPRLDVPELSDGAWAARSRGVRVLLLDDGRADPTGGDDPHRDEVLARVRVEAVVTLREAVPGAQVTVRLLPNGRQVIATISVVVDGVVSLREFA